MTTATTVRVSAPGTPVVSDGPFAETKEQLGGYDVIDVADGHEAATWAAKMPHLAGGGGVEVRPIMEFDA
ncbi:MAG: YciI family protein [Chloroflexi bacterium]|nr:YciI family protein [Chloroflexota bacterium]MDA1004450.1 YciI family protein [Chloroflexota bacterium]